MTNMLIAIDGPAGVGKTSTAQALAARLGIPALDTGAMYRAVAYAVMSRGVAVNDGDALNSLLKRLNFAFAQGADGERCWIDGEDVTAKLRTPDVTAMVSAVCEVPEVRAHLLTLQRQWAARGFGVMEGRDIGTVVLPNAGLKIYMTARPEVRAQRRGHELGLDDDPKALEKLAGELRGRDQRDAKRREAPMKPAADAVTLDASDLTFDEQVDFIVRLAAERFDLKTYQVATLAG